MRFSICIPTFNREKLILRAIRSCLQQPGADFEVVVVDDGSTDETVREIESLNAPRIRLVRHQVNRGQSAARNLSVDVACGEWIVMLDSDDELLPNGLDFIRQRILACEEDFDCLTFMYSREDGRCSPDPALTDGPLTYSDYLRNLDQQRFYDALFCVRRTSLQRVPWQPWHMAGSVLQRLDLLQELRVATSSQLVGLIHLDADNRISHVRRGPDLARPAGVELGEEMDKILRRHGPELRSTAPRT